MRKKTLIYVLFFSIAAHFTVSAQQLPEVPAFPLTWIGQWSGNLDIYTPAGLVQSVPMSLTILPLENGNYTWTIQYGPDSTGLRPYVLEPVNPAKGYYQVNENNGIILNELLLGNKLYSMFSVQGSLLLSTVEKIGDELFYEIISTPDKPASTTGDTVFEGEDIPPVGNYNISVRQVARLRRN